MADYQYAVDNMRYVRITFMQHVEGTGEKKRTTFALKVKPGRYYAVDKEGEMYINKGRKELIITGKDEDVREETARMNLKYGQLEVYDGNIAEQLISEILDEARSNITYYTEDPSDEEEGVEDAQGQAWELAKKSPINILSDKDLKMYIAKDGKVIAALFDSIVSDKYSFDIVADLTISTEEKLRVSFDLTKAGLDEYRSLASDMEDLRLQLDVVNPYMVLVLKKYGLIITDKSGGHTIMSYPGEEEEDEAEFDRTPSGLTA